MALPLPPPYSNPIPNNPFYSPEESNVCTQSGVLTLGAGLDVDYATGTLAVAGGGAGTVQQVGTGAGLTGGPITVTGTIALAPLSPSSAGAYTNPTALDVDAYGRITSVTNGAANVPAAAYNALGVILAGTGVGSYSALTPGVLNQVLTADPLSPLGVKWEYTIPDGVTQITGTLPVFISNPSGPTADVSVAVASLASTGVVQLSDDTNSTSTTEAATINAVRVIGDVAFGAQGTADQAVLDAAAALLAASDAQTDATQALSDAAAAQTTANAAIPNATFTASGELLVGSGAGTYTALPAGGANTILSSDGLGNLSWVADSAGDVTGVTGTAPVVVDNTDPQNPIVTVTAASTTAAGVVQLSDDTNSTSTTEAATINAARVIGDVAFGAQGTADQAILDAAAAQATADAAVPNASFTAAGDLLVGAGSATFTALPTGTSGQVLKSAGTGAAPAWSSALYGAFSDSSIQTNDDLVNGNAVTLDTTASSNGFSIVSGSQITATTAGVYNIQISLQIEKIDSGTDSVEVWFKKNGTDIANSNTNIELSGNGAKQLFALNLVESLTAGQYLEVWWYSADADVQLAAVVAGTRPAIPSAIVTIVPVGA